MGIGWRVFLFEEDGTLRRISQRLRKRLRSDEERLPEYAGQTLRFAFITLELKSRRPVRIIDQWYRKYHFDGQGSIHDSIVESLREATEALDDPPSSADRVEKTGTNQVVSFTDRLEEKRREAYRWKPTPADITRMVNAIWKT